MTDECFTCHGFTATRLVESFLKDHNVVTLKYTTKNNDDVILPSIEISEINLKFCLRKILIELGYKVIFYNVGLNKIVDYDEDVKEKNDNYWAGFLRRIHRLSYECQLFRCF